MPTALTLHGYRYSVYNRIVRVTLAEKGVEYQISEVDPFAADASEDYLQLNPFGRVPTLTHGTFTVYETSAIARYVDGAFASPHLVPSLAKAAARMAQVVSIVDSYGYQPMVRQVFAHRVFRPLMGEKPAEDQIAAGLSASTSVLSALDAIAEEGLVLNAAAVTLADCHLGPMMAYFCAASEGQAMLERHAALWEWWTWFGARPSMTCTDPLQ